MTDEEKEVYLILHDVHREKLSGKFVYHLNVVEFRYYMNLNDAYNFKTTGLIPEKRFNSRLGYILYCNDK